MTILDLLFVPEDDCDYGREPETGLLSACVGLAINTWPEWVEA